VEETKLDLDRLSILPLERGHLKGAFPVVEPENSHLQNWFKTRSLHSHQEKKCKVYVAVWDDVVIGYSSLAMTFPSEPIESLVNTTDHQPQMVLIGKLYILPVYRSRGIGRVMMDFTLDLALKIDEMLGCVGLIVDASNNPKTVKFYKRFGFEIINETTRTTKMFFKLSSEPIEPVEQ